MMIGNQTEPVPLRFLRMDNFQKYDESVSKRIKTLTIAAFVMHSPL